MKKSQRTAGIPYDADREPGREPAESDGDPGAELHEALVQRHLLVEVALDYHA